MRTAKENAEQASADIFRIVGMSDHQITVALVALRHFGDLCYGEGYDDAEEGRRFKL